jgi:hypothetical protein
LHSVFWLGLAVRIVGVVPPQAADVLGSPVLFGNQYGSSAFASFGGVGSNLVWPTSIILDIGLHTILIVIGIITGSIR